MSLEAYIRFLGSRFYIAGLEREDIEQEARLAALLAPAGMERLAARRQIVDLLRTSQREKRGTLVALASEPAGGGDVLDVVCNRETLREAIEGVRTDAEAVALGRVLRGETIGRHEPRLGVAIWRLRRRLEVVFP